MELKNIEFALGPNNTDIYINQNGTYNVFDENCINIIDLLYERIKDEYPECFNALKSIYTNSFHFKYLYVRRFIKCNLSKADEIMDIDENGTIHFEFISCPMRGECKHEGIICNPKFNTTLSERELEVAKLICENLSDEQIADKLYISYYTVCNHRKKILRKLGVHNKQGILDYATKHNLL